MDARIDPVTRGYVFLNGAIERDAAGGLGNAVYLRLMTPLGSYWADVTLGSRLHEITREKDLARNELLARQYAEQALVPIVQDGRAKSITVTTQREPGRLDLLVEVVSAAGERLVFKYPVKVS